MPRTLKQVSIVSEVVVLVVLLGIGLPSLFRRAYPHEAYLLAAIITGLWLLAAFSLFLCIRSRRLSLLGLFAICGYIALLLTGWFNV
jgi:hypothetical protein